MQKKAFLLIFVTVLVFIFTSCSKLKNAVIDKHPDMSSPFSCSFSISLDEDTEVSGTMSKLGTGIWSMDITSPETMSGLNISYSTEGVKASLGELELQIPKEKINAGAAFELVFSAIDSYAADAAPTLTETEEGLRYIGELSQIGFTMTFDKETLQLTNIDFGENGISAKISNISPLGAEPQNTPEAATSE